MKTKTGLRFAIAFDTKEMPGKIVATTVELGTWIMTKSDEVNVALADHPLYPALERYVRDNPSRQANAKSAT